MTGTELLVDLPKMQRDLQRARDESTRLRALLRQLDVREDTLSVPATPDTQVQQQDDDDNNDDEVEEIVDRHGRGPEQELARVRRKLQSDAESHALELKMSEERNVQLERQLLDAEEALCHLRAEKMAALRDAERLRLALDGRRPSVSSSEEEDHGEDHGDDKQLALRRLVLELEAKLSEMQRDHATEQEQHMAVIREQEHELRELETRLEETQRELSSVRDKYLDAVHEIQLAADTETVDGGNQGTIVEEQDAVVLSPPEWQQELVRHPTPTFDLDSPEVQYLLHAWTANVKKLHYLRLWLTQIATTRGPLPSDVPMGIELPRLAPEVRDGFLTLVVPLLRRQTEREVNVHSRRYNDGIHTDLRLRVVPRR